MNKTYNTSGIAGIIGIHPNTVRLYEKLKLIPAPLRKENGYRVFTQQHIDQFKVARLAFEVEILQNGLRKLAVRIVKTSANGDFIKALELTNLYLSQVQKEKRNAEEAISITEDLIKGKEKEAEGVTLTRREAAQKLDVTIDTLRNWELNGLLTVKRKNNGYRIYTENDLQRLKIIRSLRCANYSLSAIIRMLRTLDFDSEANIRAVIDTPKNKEDMVTACDRLLTSLEYAERNARQIKALIEKMQREIKF